MAKLINKDDAKNLINSGELVIIDFFATWCGPCQMFGPIFTEVSEEIDVKMAKIDIDQETEFAGENDVMGVPTIVAYKNGKEVARFSGFRPKDELIAFINENK